ncbi:MAG: Rrf2 family transcriptional regulator [Chloroflexota bacterium]
MTTNSQFTVGTHILTLLALHDGPISSRTLSRSINTNPVVVRRIVGALHDAELVATQMGVGGGTTLARPADEITLRDVFIATQPAHVIPLHASEPNAACNIGRHIQPVLTPVFERAQAAMEAELDATTIAEVAAGIQQRAEAIAEPS